MIRDLPKGLLDTAQKTLDRNRLMENKAAEVVKQELGKMGKSLEQLTPEEKKALFAKVDRLVKADDEVKEATKALGFSKDLKTAPQKDTDGAHEHNPVDYQSGSEQEQDEAKRKKRDMNVTHHPLEDRDMSKVTATEAVAEACVHHAEENCSKCQDEAYTAPKKKKK